MVGVSFRPSILPTLMGLTLTILSVAESRAETLQCIGEGTGPTVGVEFVAERFDATGRGEGIFVVWRDEQLRIQAGILRPDDESFEAFAPQMPPGGYLTNLQAGVGGPPDDRRLYVSLVDNTLQLQILVFDADGNVITPLQPIANSVQVVPVSIRGTDTGAILSYSWDDNFSWDPRALAVDVNGAAAEEEIAENALGQTLGVGLAAASSGEYALAYMQGSFTTPHLRRYDADGPVDAQPIPIAGVSGPARSPFVTLFTPSQGTPFLFLGLSHSNTPGVGDDLRFAHATLSAGPVTVGSSLSDLVPAFPGLVTDMVALTGSPELAVVSSQVVERQDPCFCSIPPPVRVEHFVQLISASTAPAAVGEPVLASLWLEGDPAGPPLTLPVLVESRLNAGLFHLLWSDGQLRYKTLQVAPSVVATEALPRQPGVNLEAPFPNPFNPSTQLRFTLSHPGYARLSIVDVRGRWIRDLILADLPAGEHRVRWDGTAATGGRVASGNYYARLEHRGLQAVQKLTLVQ